MCRVGITTDPYTRRQYWAAQHPTLRNWEIVSAHDAKDAAEWAAHRLSQERDCSGVDVDAAPPTPSAWHVYIFEY